MGTHAGRRPGLTGWVTALLVGALGCGDDSASGGAGGGGAPPCVEIADGRCVEETFKNPPLLEPNADGVYELTLQPTEILIDGERHCGRAYNGQYPAPTIDTAASADPRSVRVDLRNAFSKSDYRALGQEPCTCTDSETGESCAPSAHGHGGTCTCTTESGAACHMFDFNVTNLHAHGSHVRPDYASGGGCVEEDGLACRGCESDASAEPRECFFADDVISRVEPGGGARHRWDIDEDGVHHAGLNWYHPHIHGSTAIQVASGATGAWIVRGALDELPGLKDAKERVLLITTPPVDYEPLAEGEPCDEDHLTFNDFAILGDTSAKQTNLINGVRRPRIVMPPGQIERWRLLHGAFLDEITLALFRGLDADCSDLDLQAPPIALTQIGRDGVPMAKPESGEGWPFAPPYVFMAPGYRVEALLDGSQLAHGDTLCLMSGRFLQQDTTDPNGDALTPEEILQVASNGDLVAIVNVSNAAGPPSETQMPDLDAISAESPSMLLQGGATDALSRCEEAAAIDSPEEIEQLSFMWAIPANQEGFDGCACPDHNLNCKNFETTDRDLYPYDRVLTVGDVDHWRLKSGFDGHPFHIHINPFVVCPMPEAGASAKGRLFEPPFAHWRDTYLVNLDRTVDVVTEYRSYAGSYVYHCHKLTHEDHGMMELVHVCDPESEDCGALCAGGECGWRACAEGDENCVRALTATECLLDPLRCPEALLRCTTCDAEQSCPPEAHCSDVVHADGELRCVPGCVTDADCPITDACDPGGSCVPAPCSPPCGPPAMCEHGACVP